MSNTVKVAAGNFGKQRYNVSVGADKFNIVAGYEKRGKADNMSGYIGKPTAKTTVYDYGKGDRKSVLWNWKMLDGLTFTHSYSNNKHEYWQKKLCPASVRKITITKIPTICSCFNTIKMD